MSPVAPQKPSTMSPSGTKEANSDTLSIDDLLSRFCDEVMEGSCSCSYGDVKRVVYTFDGSSVSDCSNMGIADSLTLVNCKKILEEVFDDQEFADVFPMDKKKESFQMFGRSGLQYEFLGKITVQIGVRIGNTCR
jgi:hypothetical protein